MLKDGRLALGERKAGENGRKDPKTEEASKYSSLLVTLPARGLRMG